MSLQVWLPLNGDLKNKGCNTANSIQTTAPAYVTGKLGKAMSSGAFQLPAADIAKFYNNKAMSFAFWIYPFGSGGGAIIGNSAMSAGDNRMFTIFQYPNPVDIHLSWQNETSSGTFLSAVWSTVLTASTWNHVVITYNGTTAILYVNGIQKGTTSGTSNRTNFSYNVPVPNNTSTRYLCDLRIYDHCLSVTEVKELAKGLVVHYKLDNEGTSNPNLVTSTNTGNTDRFGYSEQTGGSTKSVEYDGSIPCIKVTRNSTAHSGWGYLWHTGLVTSSIKTSTVYTVSFDAIASGTGSIVFNGFMQGNATNTLSASVAVIQGSFNASKWSHIILQTTTKSSFDGISIGAQVVYMGCGYMNNVNVWLKIKNFKVEEGSVDTFWSSAPSDTKYTRLGYNPITVSDCSGNGYNATKSGTITVSTNTPRYDLSTQFATSSHITAPTLTVGGFTNTYTFSWWGKYTNYTGHMMWGFSNGNRLNLYMSNGNFYWNTGDGTNNPFNVSAATYGDGNWHHFAVTGDGTTTKLYIDGVFKANAATYKGITGTIIYMNGWDSSSSYNFSGQLSDFRLYATPLSANDVLHLYNTPASISKNGTMLGYEFKEG